jgi:hypothetical protein
VAAPRKHKGVNVDNSCGHSKMMNKKERPKESARNGKGRSWRVVVEVKGKGTKLYHERRKGR